MGQGRAQIYNLISILFLVLSIAAIVLVAARMAGPPAGPQRPQVAVPTAAILPSATLTLTWTPSFTPTFTLTPSETITPTLEPSITWTQIPTLTPSLTFTVPPTATIGPTSTTAPTSTIEPSLTITNTLDVTNTPVPTETPTVNDFTPVATQPPPSPFPFVLKDNQVIYTMNFANTAQCAWQGIGGQVFDLNGQPLIQMRVHVFGQGVDLYTSSGSNTLYGLSGWEVPLSTTVTSNSYIVELQSAQGTIISPQVTVTFVPDCSKNLALVSFQQTRPF
ncbi:MAG: hypothetical protein GC204_13410 [Chloroflexi bacterium]|nr:hypothetical protein [Chloroflexota bacterium]